MPSEIERKFLVRDTSFLKGLTGSYIAQGYLSADPERTVRVRIKDNQGYLTIKGKTDGISRIEFEYQIPLGEAKNLLDLCLPTIIEKERFLVTAGNHIYEIDQFKGDNEGLIIAEIELNHEDETFEKPDWLGKEVSHETQYFNSALSQKPYIKWI